MCLNVGVCDSARYITDTDEQFWQQAITALYIFHFFRFFPNVVQPPISVVCNAIHACLVKVRVCRRPVKKYDVGAPSSITISLPGVEPQDAERRR